MPILFCFVMLCLTGEDRRLVDVCVLGFVLPVALLVAFLIFALRSFVRSLVRYFLFFFSLNCFCFQQRFYLVLGWRMRRCRVSEPISL